MVAVPQDSIFSSFLFPLHINDPPHAVISSDVHQYADDTLMFYCNLNLPMLEVKFHDDIDSIVHWLVSKGLTCLRLRSACKPSTYGCYYIAGNRLRCVTVAKHRYLGFYMFILIKAFNSTLTIWYQIKGYIAQLHRIQHLQLSAY